MTASHAFFNPQQYTINSSKGNDRMFTYNRSKEYLFAYNKIVEQRIEEGWIPYLLTFTFGTLIGNRQTKLSQMTREIERVYSTMLTRIVRVRPSQLLPVWIASPDLPVPKNNKLSSGKLPLNDGLHFHAICLIPPTHRLKRGLAHHVERYRNLYLRDRRILRDLHVEHIDTEPGKVTEYSLKTLLRGRLDPDSLVLFPRTQSEMPNDDRNKKAGPGHPGPASDSLGIIRELNGF